MTGFARKADIALAGPPAMMRHDALRPLVTRVASYAGCRPMIRPVAIMVILCLAGASCRAEKGVDRNIANAARAVEAEANKVIPAEHWIKDFRCPTGWHEEPKGSFQCARDPIPFEPEQRVDGTISIAFEKITLTPSRPLNGAEHVDEFWLSFANSGLESCVIQLGARRRTPFAGRVSLIGKVASGGQFGHLGAYGGEIQVQRFIAGNPCSDPAPE